MKQGFTLIEAVLYVALSGMLATALFTSFNQTNRSVAQADALIDLDMWAVIALGQLETDISGVFMPRFSKPLKETKPISPVRPGQRPSPPKPKIQRIIKDLFLAKTQEGQLTDLTFITNNTMQVYGKAVPRIGRVAYKIKPDLDNKGAYRLVRQESAELDYEKWQDKQPREYTLLENIKGVKVSFKVPKTPPKPKGVPGQKPQKQPESAKIEYETKDSWISPVELKTDETVSATATSDKPEKIIPQYVILNLEVLDAQKRTVKFELLIRIWAYEATHRLPKKRPSPFRAPGMPGMRRPGQAGGMRPTGMIPSGKLQLGKAVEGLFADKPHMNKIFEKFYGPKKGKK